MNRAWGSIWLEPLDGWPARPASLAGEAAVTEVGWRPSFRDAGQSVRNRRSRAPVTGLREFLPFRFCVEKGEPGRGARERGDGRNRSSRSGRVGPRTQSTENSLFRRQEGWIRRGSGTEIREMVLAFSGATSNLVMEDRTLRRRSQF